MDSHAGRRVAEGAAEAGWPQPVLHAEEQRPRAPWAWTGRPHPAQRPVLPGLSSPGPIPPPAGVTATTVKGLISHHVYLYKEMYQMHVIQNLKQDFINIGLSEKS